MMMIAKRLFPKLLLLMLIPAILSVAMKGETGPAPATVQKVLIISSYNPAHPYYANFTRGLTGRLEEEGSASFQFFFESVDSAKFSLVDNFHENMAAALQQKYSHNLPDIIVANGPQAIHLVLRHGQEIFRDIPVIAATYQPIEVSEQLPANFMLFSPPLEAERNVQLILDIQPEVKKLYVVTGSSDSESRVREELQEQLAPFSGRLTIIRLNSFAFSDILELVRNLKSDAAVLFVNFIMDGRGQSFAPIQALRAICDESAAPVYAVLDTGLGSGAVGGYMLNSTAFGRQTGEKILAGLLGRRLQNQIKTEDMFEYKFDWRQLSKGNIDEGNLPVRSTVLYRPASFWQSYMWYLVGGTFVIAGQAALIALLVINRKRRLQAEWELARADRLHLAGEIAAGISHEIRNPLTTIRGYLQLWGRRQQAPSPETLKTVISELDRVNGIITEFLNLAKNKLIELAPHQINQLVQGLLPIVQSEANLRGHEIVFVSGDIPAVAVDEKEVVQVVLNLVMNGLDAMQQGHGVVTIRTWQAVDRVVLAVSDQGTGIADDVAAKIGTPFFTTKANGTGLGLSVCFAIAERLGGKLTFETGSKGTTFYFFLPLPKNSDSF